MTRVLFVNSGLLGQRTFAHFVTDAFADDAEIQAKQIVLTDDLTPVDRVIRRLMCVELAPHGSSLTNVDLFRYRAEMNSGWQARRRIGALERAGERFDVLHFHRQSTAYASLARMRTTPSIVSIDCTQRLLVERAGGSLEARTYAPNMVRDGEVFRAARLIIATSQWAADCVGRDYPDCGTEVAVMPNPVQLEWFDEAWTAEREARRSAAGFRPRVLFIGGDLRRKGGEDLLAVWRDSQLGTIASLDVVTASAVDPQLVCEGVTIHHGVDAHTPAWVDLWRRSDVFVLPTRDEAFGTVFQEAAAAAIPAIGTRLNAVPEIIKDGETGLLVGAGDRAGLACALTDLIANHDRRMQMGRCARATIARTAHPDRYRERLTHAIGRVASA